MVPNNLIITRFIVNCIDCRSAAFVGQTSVPYNNTSSTRAVVPPPNLPTATLHISKETYLLSHNPRIQTDPEATILAATS